MRTVFGLIGIIVLTGAGLVVTSSPAGSQTRGASAQPAPTKPAAVKPGTTAAKQIKAEEIPVRESLSAFVKSFSAGELESLAALFNDDAVVVDSAGDEVRGKQSIAEMYGASFREIPGLKLEVDVREIQFLTPDVARAEGRSRISSPNGDASEFTRFSTLLTGKDHKWTLAEIRQYPLPPEDVPTSERLRELEWMVGDWIDESGENKVSSSIRWAENKSYLVRTYRIDIPQEKSNSGTMFIGWEPQNGQIKSWVFNSEGGHGEGLWTKTGENTWVVKAQGVLRDGRPTSATQIHTIMNKDAVKTSSIDRIIGGQVAPDILDILMVRKPPKPQAAAPKPAASIPN
jgi:uncharacterized protein (TIGR02246 family)